MKKTKLTTAQLTSEIESAIETYRDIEGCEPDATNVMDALCDDARKADFYFDEPLARTIIAKKLVVVKRRR